MELILASTSPRRKELLSLTGISFVQIKSPYQEKTPLDGADPHKYALSQALGKARALKEIYPDALIIGADTIVSINDRILGKPKDRIQAYEYLSLLSGMIHQVITGVVVIGKHKEITHTVTTEIVFNTLSRKEIERYLDTNEYIDKAGAYAIQGKARTCVHSMKGSMTNVMGLPLYRLAEMLLSCGVEIKKEVIDQVEITYQKQRNPP